MKKYYQLVKKEEAREAEISIYGDITSWPWLESDVSAYSLSREIAALDVDSINVYINSYGGEVAEGLAIYNALRRHKAKVKTVCDGFACSIASVIFMAGDERVMNSASLLMVHNAWTHTEGNAEALRKEANDLDTITQATVAAYLERVSISEDKVHELMDGETWLKPTDAMEMGFATSVVSTTAMNANQSARKLVFARLTERTVEAVLPIEPMPASEEKTVKTFLDALCAKKGE